MLREPASRPRRAGAPRTRGRARSRARLEDRALSAAITLVILSYNRAQELERTIAHALALPENPPVVVVDNASSDGAAERVAARFPQVELVRLPRNLGAAGRNIGVGRARTPYVAFSDDDTMWAQGSLALAASLLEAYPRVAALTARVLIGREEREDPVSAEMAASPLPAEGLPGPRLLGFLAGATIFRRSAFVEAGGYEPRLFIGGEERLLAYDLTAAGWALCYVERLTVHHYPSKVRDAEARRRLLVRNALWTAWMRRPWRAALRETLRGLGRPGFGEALGGALWALRRRRVMPPFVAEWCDALDSAAQRTPPLAAGAAVGVKATRLPARAATSAPSSPRSVL